MKTYLALPAALIASLTIAGCDPATQNAAGAGAAGAGIAAVGAQLLGANPAWTVAAGAAGAAAGAIYARHRENGNCAYYTGNTLPSGDQEVIVQPCRA